MVRERMGSVNPTKTEAAGIYAGMDCCCNAGSIAISNEAPLWSDVGRGNEFSVAYGRWQAAWPTGWLYLPPSSLSCPAPLSSETDFRSPSRGGVPTIGHFGDCRRSSLATKVKIPGDGMRSTAPISEPRSHEGHRHHGVSSPWYCT